MNNEVRAKFAAWAGRAYLVMGDDLEEICTELAQYFHSRTAFDTQKELLISIVVSGCPVEVQQVYDVVMKSKRMKAQSESEKEARKMWNTKYRYRVLRIIDTVGVSKLIYTVLFTI